MDRNSVTGLVLIGLILTIFSVINQPSADDYKKKEKTTTSKTVEKTNKKAKSAATVSANAGSEMTPAQKAHKAKQVETGKIISLGNEVLHVDFNTKGGIVSAVYLKKYKSYKDFAAKRDAALCLFKNGHAFNQLVIPVGNQKIHTKNYLFEVVKQDAHSIVFEAPLAGGKIRQSYSLNKSYDLDYNVELIDLKGVATDNIALNWKAEYQKTERLFSEQRRVSTVCFNQKNEGFDFLSETTNDYQEAEDDIEWVAFKQSYFSSILKPSNAFPKKGTKFNINTFKGNKHKSWTLLKGYSATMAMDFTNNKASFNWYFGPNDYELLKSYNSNYDDILNFGWGLFRWINLYAVQPIFNLLVDFGLSIGIAILILTLIIKLILMPIQWKMFVSSVKMRILKPEVDELNAKYPKQEDSMKKQMEMMTLYRESGASPLAGCVPMLIQMPILLAVFRFFPAAFELRQQPFLWATDLSSYDSVLDFGFSIWPYGDHISLFTLLMAGTTLAYTFMNSGNVQQPQQPGMPNMKVIMYIFPIMMIFFFNNYSAGLSYYYFISTLISILMMVVIKRFFVDEDKLRVKMAERKSNNSGGDKAKKKSRFQEKLEEMQRKQQEMIKNKK
ncbi:MAG: membrane protein insertase YidC [Flavobacteriales bacterium]